LQGVDAFLDWTDDGRSPDTLGNGLQSAAPDGWQLKMITNRGVKVFPDGLPETFCTDHWRCRFVRSDGGPTDFAEVLALLGSLHAAGYDVIKTEHLYTFDGERAYSLGQGE
jgi:isocitrate dehydrogenase